MRSLLGIAALAAALVCGATSANAEKRIFVIANNGDSYGVDRCLASGESCGAAAAAAYCRSREFTQAASYRRVDRDDITGSVPISTGSACRGSECEEFVAIECAR
jgi:hypothetical protein